MALTRATDKIIANADGNLNLSGIVTASSFDGSLAASKLTGALPAISGQNLTNLPAGLGTALSNVSTNPLNKLYYVNSILSIDSSTIVDPPSTALAVYTNYAEIRIEESIDLTIESGDLVPDVLDLYVS